MKLLTRTRSGKGGRGRCCARQRGESQSGSGRTKRAPQQGRVAPLEPSPRGRRSFPAPAGLSPSMVRRVAVRLNHHSYTGITRSTDIRERLTDANVGDATSSTFPEREAWRTLAEATRQRPFRTTAAMPYRNSTKTRQGIGLLIAIKQRGCSQTTARDVAHGECSNESGVSERMPKETGIGLGDVL